ncbi:cell division protein ZapA [Sphingomonas changnyeongensis]|uniref:Cell division protein ZapA n=1 Tax=Sphingomonas changnyeongensis TaxID=2698679 RepID=A0A7Z2S5Q7_9SPHN|nr:cell division protein ZapA [Sphingomonas changnyeongensis]QHL90613.1 cell division protein ZapA [Sphingomonas changnyeongensis]
MADVTIEIGGRRYDVTCRDGEEDQLRRLARLVDDKAAQARAAVGGVTEVRQLLLASLLLADELVDLRAARDRTAGEGAGREGRALPPVATGAPAGSGPIADPAIAGAIEQLAARMERIADQIDGGERA